ncbi:hypothetical protein Cni_G19069 [Canna indica]|uniref:Uncharacterized protein n=1 Tax=Canna indica TaxID=4628 RepID=A0AAQ3KKD6_9LILI|nr:hypothetical protein Cni_G19069 [Canna indica]
MRERIRRCLLHSLGDLPLHRPVHQEEVVSAKQQSKSKMRISTAVDLPSPFGHLGISLFDVDLCETAYEIFVAASRTTGAKPITYIPQSERTPTSADRSSSSSSLALSFSPSSSSLQRSLTSTATS